MKTGIKMRHVLLSPLLLLAGIVLVTARAEPVLVLAYHRVSSAPPGPVPAVRPADFARQLDYLTRAGYRSVTPAALARHLARGGGLPRRAVLITFDDGWADNFTGAWPLLRARGYTATVFVVSGRIGRRGYLTIAQLRTLARAGWTIGAHTITHPHLPDLEPARAKAEVAVSRAALAGILGRPVTVFAYPYGDDNRDIRALVSREGFKLGFGTRLGFPRRGDDPMDVRRITMPRRDGLTALYLAAAPLLNAVRRVLSRLAATRPALEAQEVYSRRLWRRATPSLPPRK